MIILDVHWHVDRHEVNDGERVTLTACTDPCVRSDMAYFVLPACGPDGVTIRQALEPLVD